MSYYMQQSELNKGNEREILIRDCVCRVEYGEAYRSHLCKCMHMLEKSLYTYKGCLTYFKCVLRTHLKYVTLRSYCLY
jgi:hypothetical protein